MTSLREPDLPGIYWGAPRILARLGWSPKSSTKFPGLIKRYRIPAFLRVDPHNKFRRTYYASEGMLLAWELAMAKAYRQRLVDKDEARREGR